MATANLSKTTLADPAALGRQLGVRYLLEGNVRRVGTNLRVTTQLLEAATGAVQWAARFDRPLAELAELQEELVTEVAASLEAQVYSIEVERALRKPSDITAWEAVARSLSAYRKYDAAALESGIEEARRAVAIAPDYAPGHAMLAVALANAYVISSSDDPDEILRIRAVADRALALAPEDASVLGSVGIALCYVGHPDEGVRLTELAVRKAPGSGLLHFYHGASCLMVGRLDEALSHLNTAERLTPGSHMMWAVKAWQHGAYRESGLWVEANATSDQVISLIPTWPHARVYKAFYSLKLGRDAEAHRHIETARRMGVDLAQAERTWRRTIPKSPSLEADIAAVRALYAATEPGA